MRGKAFITTYDMLGGVDESMRKKPDTTQNKGKQDLEFRVINDSLITQEKAAQRKLAC